MENRLNQLKVEMIQAQQHAKKSILNAMICNTVEVKYEMLREINELLKEKLKSTPDQYKMVVQDCIDLINKID